MFASVSCMLYTIYNYKSLLKLLRVSHFKFSSKSSAVTMNNPSAHPYTTPDVCCIHLSAIRKWIVYYCSLRFAFRPSLLQVFCCQKTNRTTFFKIFASRLWRSAKLTRKFEEVRRSLVERPHSRRENQKISVCMDYISAGGVAICCQPIRVNIQGRYANARSFTRGKEKIFCN